MKLEDRMKVFILIGIRNVLEIYRIYRTVDIFIAMQATGVDSFREKLNFGPAVLYIASNYRFNLEVDLTS